MLSRRSFLQSVLVSGAALACSSESSTEPDSADPARLTMRARRPTRSTSPGVTVIETGGRRAYLHVPPTYRVDEALPLVVAFHGGGGRGSDWVQYPARTDAARMIFLAPESARSTWDALITDFGEDVAFTNVAIAETIDRCNVDVNRVALMGFSDGASYALALGLANGDRVRSVIAHSAGAYLDPSRRGSPSFFFSHGDDDPIFAAAETSGFFVELLRKFGMSVEYVQFSGGHEIPAAIQDQAVAWLKARFV